MPRKMFVSLVGLILVMAALVFVPATSIGALFPASGKPL
jgi:hypothetical protein